MGGSPGRAQGRQRGGLRLECEGGRMPGLLRGLVHERACRGGAKGEARSAVLNLGSLTVPRAEAAGTRGRGVPGDGAWHWDVRAPDTVSTPPTGGARALSSGASHPAPSPWVELGSTQVASCFAARCRVLWRSVVSRCLLVCYVVMFCCCWFWWGSLGCLCAALFCGSGCGPFRCFPFFCGSLLTCCVGMFVACCCCVVWCRVSCCCVLSCGRTVPVLCRGVCCVVACCVVVLCFGALGWTLVCGVGHCLTVLCVVICGFVALYSMLRCVPLLSCWLWMSFSCCRACCCVLCLGVA